MTTTMLSPVDVGAIKALTTPWTEACLARDWDKLLSHCTDDVVLLPPDEPAVSGAHVRPWFEKYPEIKAFTAVIEHVEGNDQAAFGRGRFTITVVPPGATEPMTITGKFSDGFRKDANGRWRYATVMWNADLPAPLTGLAAKGATAPLQALGLVPSLTVDDLDASIRWFEGLGFLVTDRWEQDGVLNGVMLGAGNAMLGLARDDGQRGKDRIKGVGSRLWIETKQDVDTLAARAKKAGVKLEKEPYDTPWHSRAFEVKTPEGFAITLSTPMT